MRFLAQERHQIELRASIVSACFNSAITSLQKLLPGRATFSSVAKQAGWRNLRTTRQQPGTALPFFSSTGNACSPSREQIPSAGFGWITLVKTFFARALVA